MSKPTREYLKGRQAIDGRKLRYDACTDILIVIHRILTEYVADCMSPYFHSEHPEYPQVRELLDSIDVESMDSREIREWLNQVAKILPFLWD